MSDPPADRDAIARCMTALVAARGPGKTICPSEVARALGGSDETVWRRLMKPVRAVAVELAGRGEVTIRRQGRAVDPADFKGVYRIGPGGD